MDAETIKSLGFPIAATCGLAWYIWRVTRFLLTDLKSSIEELKDIVVSLINAKNEHTKVLANVETRIAEVREQQRNIVSEFRMKKNG